MAKSAANRVYENFEPPSDWAHDEGSDTLILVLPGFKRDQLKVQITSTGILKIQGERQIDGNKWRRFSKEFTIPSDCGTNDIGAKFEGGLLFVKLQKLITQARPQETPKPPEEVPKSKEPSQEGDQQKATQEVSPKPRKDKEEETVKETSEKVPQKEKKPSDAKEMGNIEADANKEAQKKEKRTNGLDEETKATTSKVQEKDEAPTGLGKSGTILLSRQMQDYREALAGLIGRLDKQKKVASLIVAILLVVVLGLYVKNAVKSFHGRSKIHEL